MTDPSTLISSLAAPFGRLAGKRVAKHLALYVIGRFYPVQADPALYIVHSDEESASRSVAGSSPVDEPDSPTTAALDVVFLHGLGGDHLTTFFCPALTRRSKKHGLKEGQAYYLPSVVTRTILRFHRDAAIRVLTIQYASPPLGQSLAIPEVARRAHDTLVEAGVGQRPFLVVAHSLGGLILKSVLDQSASTGGRERNKLRRAFTGVVFLATPHLGALLPKLVGYLDALGMRSALVKGLEFEFGDGPLERLQQTFSTLREEASQQIGVHYLCEDRAVGTLGKIVDYNSAVFGRFPKDQVHIVQRCTHLDIARPSDPTDLDRICQSVVDLLPQNLVPVPVKALELPSLNERDLLRELSQAGVGPDAEYEEQKDDDNSVKQPSRKGEHAGTARRFVLQRSPVLAAMLCTVVGIVALVIAVALVQNSRSWRYREFEWVSAQAVTELLVQGVALSEADGRRHGIQYALASMTDEHVPITGGSWSTWRRFGQVHETYWIQGPDTQFKLQRFDLPDGERTVRAESRNSDISENEFVARVWVATGTQEGSGFEWMEFESTDQLWRAQGSATGSFAYIVAEYDGGLLHTGYTSLASSDYSGAEITDLAGGFRRGSVVISGCLDNLEIHEVWSVADKDNLYTYPESRVVRRHVLAADEAANAFESFVSWVQQNPPSRSGGEQLANSLRHAWDSHGPRVAFLAAFDLESVEDDYLFRVTGSRGLLCR